MVLDATSSTMSLMIGLKRKLGTVDAFESFTAMIRADGRLAMKLLWYAMAVDTPRVYGHCLSLAAWRSKPEHHPHKTQHRRH